MGRVIGLSLVVLILPETAFCEDKTVFTPQIEGEWWQIAGDPDLGEVTTEKQQPVDFAVWQAADGTWQLWSCIRNTKAGGKKGLTRLFHRWEGRNPKDRDWKPMGIAMQADPNLGETPGGLQAPYVVKIGDIYHMFYGDWNHVCVATSPDGKTFTRRVNADGKTGMFSEGAGANTRDAMVLRINDLWHCYYTAFPNGKGAVYCRTSADTRTWSESKIVSSGGRGGTGPTSTECPHIVPVGGEYYLFRTQTYGKDMVTHVYHSRDPMDFGIDREEGHFVCSLPVAAPEIIRHDGQDYIASLLPSLKGIQIARLKWVRTSGQ